MRDRRRGGDTRRTADRPTGETQADVIDLTDEALRRQRARLRRVVALIPAHNEAGHIVATVQSLRDQTRPLDRIIVLADNCTDATPELAAAAGAEVVVTVDNAAKKAGALNQGLALVMPTLDDDDLVLCMDADSRLRPDFMEQAVELLSVHPDVGGLSGALVAREHHNYLELAQAVEYARGSRQVARKGGQVHVLSGAAAVMRVGVLREVARSRGTRLPGAPGSIYMEDSLTEDYELTLAVRRLGYRCICTKRCQVVTDVMPTLRDLAQQRVRWYRGAMESLSLYGWSELTHKTWAQVGLQFLSSLVLPLLIVLIAVTFIFFDPILDARWFVIWPILWIDQWVVFRRLGIGFVASLRWFFPLLVYDYLLFVFSWLALTRLAKQTERTWITGSVVPNRKEHVCTEVG
ncbi:glycosyltransferase family 2 protein [Egicoccus sp. AB-alg6-2]|uniref:glycosyltransferase family 2 protein n=1 Tax=Egicoccus sp. AB-alg6-2 TaxID=3242692 RepID=UPI00359E4259